jgi:hypothetical protein
MKSVNFAAVKRRSFMLTMSRTLLSISLLLLPASLLASEYKRIANYDSIEYGQSTGQYTCDKKCSEVSDAPLESFNNSGWKVTSSSPTEKIVETFSKSEGGMVYGLKDYDRPRTYIPPYSNGCKCIGREYVLERIEATAVPAQPEVTTVNLLKKENDLLKKEIELLKNENKDLQEKLGNKKKSKKASSG